MIDITNQGSTQAPEVDFVALHPGQTIGRYEIVSVLGQGGFGITYRANDIQLNREVAIKEYLPSALAVRQDGSTVLPRSTKMAEDFGWGRERFVAEGRTLATLQRAPGIVRVFDFLEANGTAYIVMELVPGQTLDDRLRKGGTLTPEEVDRILWPLLDGMDRVHAAGFLHRDIKPANILLDADGNPTLIDFGASRAAMVGRAAAVMTAIFTPGYAAAEQFTAAKQGPWTDIYGISATLYHGIVGTPPPSAFDRMLDDGYEPLGRLQPPGFAPGLLVGIDAGLAVRATDRPQSIAGWRQIPGHASTLGAHATVALAKPNTLTPPYTPRPSIAAPPVAAPRPTLQPTPTVQPAPTPTQQPAPVAKRPLGLWIAAAAGIALVLAGGGYYFARTSGPDPAVLEAARKQQQMAEAEAAKRRAAEEELAKLRAAEAARVKAAEDKAKAEQEARLKAEAEAAERKGAEAAETALGFSLPDRQRVQVALTALGFNTGGTDGLFTPLTREKIAAWQKAHGAVQTGFLSGLQNQTLLKEAAPAVARFDDELKRAAATPAPVPTPPPATRPGPPTPVPPTPAPESTAPAPGSTAEVIDGLWQGTYDCQAGRDANVAPPFTLQVRVVLIHGTGAWVPPVARGTAALGVQVTGESVRFTRTVSNPDQTKSDTYLSGRLQGSTITASGRESPFGRNCTVVMVRTEMPTTPRTGGGGHNRR